MKLVSPKTLLVSLLGCTFVVMKVMTFDGLPDIFWIIFIGYMSVKGLVVAFSQKAYDEDMKQAQQRKVLYRDLFGKFAYVAADIPIFLILLAGLLAVVCPITTLLKVILVGLLLIALGYAIWLCWYVSRHKRLRMENGEWGTGVLSAEDEKAWKRSNLWHSIILGIVVVLSVLYLIFGNPRIYLNNAKLEKALSALGSNQEQSLKIYSFSGENDFISVSNGVIVLDAKDEICYGGDLEVKPDEFADITTYSATIYFDIGNERVTLMSNSVEDITGGTIGVSRDIGKITGDIVRDSDIDKLVDNLWFELKTTDLNGQENTCQLQLETTEITKRADS